MLLFRAIGWFVTTLCVVVADVSVPAVATGRANNGGALALFACLLDGTIGVCFAAVGVVVGVVATTASEEQAPSSEDAEKDKKPQQRRVGNTTGRGAVHKGLQLGQGFHLGLRMQTEGLTRPLNP